MQRAMTDTSRRSGARRDAPAKRIGAAGASSRSAGSAKEPLWRLAKEVHRMIKLGILMALRRFDKNDAPFADPGF
eukprot:9775780-Alexandrium_andersonii.AAC.1